MWETALRLARKEIDTNNKRKHNHAKRDTSSIRAQVVYAEHCARKGALSKVNQTIPSNSMSNNDPNNIDLLRAKHPETVHPDRDPVRLSSRLCLRCERPLSEKLLTKGRTVPDRVSFGVWLLSQETVCR